MWIEAKKKWAKTRNLCKIYGISQLENAKAIKLVLKSHSK
jgi:hypothetical protein